MKSIITSVLLLLSFKLFGQIQYVAPMPGSIMQNPNRNILIRPGDLLDASSLSPSLFIISGSVSGAHDFTLILSMDGKTINLNPSRPFSLGEEVQVTVKAGLKATDGTRYDDYSFSFRIHQQYTIEEQLQMNDALQKMRSMEVTPVLNNLNTPDSRIASPYQILVNTNPAAGQVFFSNLGETDQTLWIVDNNGNAVLQKKSTNAGFDWKLNHNGYLTAYNTSVSFDVYDSNYVKIHSVSAVNGYTTDVHELQMFPDGHYYLIADESQVMDLRQFDPSYNSHATVTGNVIQEFDGKDNLIFEWRTFDHIIVTEALHENFSNAYVDAVHMNSLEEDNDGDLLVSCRHLDQVFKLNLQNGNFIWRLGGDSNQFVFKNDPLKFNYQHDARRLPNGNITLFDNNNWGIPGTSYAKEYQLDEVQLKATLVWSYAHPEVDGNVLASSAMGSVQRLDNGNTFIDWGIYPYGVDFPNMTEVNPGKTIVWELQYDNGEYVYRAHRDTWDPCSRPTDSKLKTTAITATSAKLNWNASTGAVKYFIEYRKQGVTNWKSVKVASPAVSYTLTDLTSKKTYEWRIQTWCNKKGTKTSDFTAIKTFTTAAARLQDLSVDAIEAFTIFPNPGTNVVILQWKHPSVDVQSTTIQILNYMAQIVLEKNITSNEGSNELTLPTSSFTKGLYFIRIKMGDKEVTSKWIKE